jgi:exodeoxyribonuclease VII small subunit
MKTEQEQSPQRFEDKLSMLEQLTARMEEGELGLEEMLKLYEEGIRLSLSLKKELDSAQASLMELKDGQLKPLAQDP